MKLLFTAIMLFFSINSYAYSDACFTHQNCAADASCQCVIPAESAYERNYYVDFTNIQKGHLYQCQLNDSMRMLVALTEASQFPEGSTYQVIDSLTHFPFSFTLNTQAMTSDSDKVIIKYLAPASDMPTTLSASCTTVS
jgi:hypothetical protein